MYDILIVFLKDFFFKKLIFNKRALGPWITHLNPGTCIGMWLKRYQLIIFLFLALVKLNVLINYGEHHIIRNISVKLF